MTIEETIQHLQEAYEMAFAALRARQTPLDRSRWEGCEYCNETQWLGGLISGTITAEVNFKTNKDVTFLYCPICGRPLTEDAWAELERRIKGG